MARRAGLICTRERIGVFRYLGVNSIYKNFKVKH